MVLLSFAKGRKRTLAFWGWDLVYPRYRQNVETHTDRSVGIWICYPSGLPLSRFMRRGVLLRLNPADAAEEVATILR
jgi:hypothetical protein